jgi:hypothetical protein
LRTEPPEEPREDPEDDPPLRELDEPEELRPLEEEPLEDEEPRLTVPRDDEPEEPDDPRDTEEPLRLVLLLLLLPVTRRKMLSGMDAEELRPLEAVARVMLAEEG